MIEFSLVKLHPAIYELLPLSIFNEVKIHFVRFDGKTEIQFKAIYILLTKFISRFLSHASELIESVSI